MRYKYNFILNKFDVFRTKKGYTKESWDPFYLCITVLNSISRTYDMCCRFKTTALDNKLCPAQY
jgi:hypothetical protein